MVFPSTISPVFIISKDFSKESSSTSISSPSDETPPPVETLDSGSYSATKKYSFSVTEPGLMYASKTFETQAILYPVSSSASRLILASGSPSTVFELIVEGCLLQRRPIIGEDLNILDPNAIFHCVPSISTAIIAVPLRDSLSRWEHLRDEKRLAVRAPVQVQPFHLRLEKGLRCVNRHHTEPLKHVQGDA